MKTKLLAATIFALSTATASAQISKPMEDVN